jgi:hypothetical protein
MGCIDVGNLGRGLGLRVLGRGIESESNKQGQEAQMGNVPSHATITAVRAAEEVAEL